MMNSTISFKTSSWMCNPSFNEVIQTQQHKNKLSNRDLNTYFQFEDMCNVPLDF